LLKLLISSTFQFKNKQISKYKTIAGVYNKQDNHWILIFVDLTKQILYYLDPFGNEQNCRLHFTAFKNWWYEILKKKLNKN
jgi:hypothetical protein